MRHRSPFFRTGIRTKIIFMILLLSVVFGTGTLAFLSFALQNTFRDQAINRTRILAEGLGLKAVVPVQVEDQNALRFIQDEAIRQPDVAYCFIRDDRGRVLTSSFEGNRVPEELQNINELKTGASLAPEPATILLRGRAVEVIDIAAPVSGGALGSVHVGLNMTFIMSHIKDLLLKIAVAGALALIVLAFLSLRLSSFLIKPVKDLTEVAEALGRGDLSKKAQVNTGDELGQLGDTLNRTIDHLEGMVQNEAERDAMQRRVMDLLMVVSSAAEGDLTVKAEVTADDLGAVADAFNLMINGLMSLVTQANNVAGEIRRSTSEILDAAERMRSGAEQQASRIRDASDAVKAMSYATQRMAENAEAATRTSVKATEAAVKGGASVSETIKGMQRIRATVQTTGKKIKGLGERSLEIGAIIAVINEIATQTNLLALNAAIEAARAGEQGRGFAVVADEVRKLAERAARATKDITGLIRVIQAETSEAVSVMEAGTHEVEEGTNLADQAGAALREIEQIVNQTSSLMTDFTRAAGDQVRSTESVAHAMETISRLTQETSNGIQGTVATISGLADLTMRLNDAIGRFKLHGEHMVPPASGETPFPFLAGYEQVLENATRSENKIKPGCIE